ncbi:MAG: response regulator [Candidatus Sulfotelmatobacter sp.]
MKLLIAEDDILFQRMLVQLLAPKYDIVLANNGDEAWEILQRPDTPQLAILDWVMPGLSGPEICRKVRACPSMSSLYLILLTSKNSEADIVSGLRAGADDYITKPPAAAELCTRIRGGERVLALQAKIEAQSALCSKLTGTEPIIRECLMDLQFRNAAARQEKSNAAPYSIRYVEPAEHRPPSDSSAEIAVNEFAIQSMESFYSKH